MGGKLAFGSNRQSAETGQRAPELSQTLVTAAPRSPTARIAAAAIDWQRSPATSAQAMLGAEDAVGDEDAPADVRVVAGPGVDVEGEALGVPSAVAVGMTGDGFEHAAIRTAASRNTQRARPLMSSIRRLPQRSRAWTWTTDPKREQSTGSSVDRQQNLRCGYPKGGRFGTTNGFRSNRATEQALDDHPVLASTAVLATAARPAPSSP